MEKLLQRLPLTTDVYRWAVSLLLSELSPCDECDVEQVPAEQASAEGPAAQQGGEGEHAAGGGEGSGGGAGGG